MVTGIVCVHARVVMESDTSCKLYNILFAVQLLFPKGKQPCGHLDEFGAHMCVAIRSRGYLFLPGD